MRWGLHNGIPVLPSECEWHRFGSATERSGGKKSYKSDAERVAFLFELYQKYTSLLPTDKPKIKRRAKVV